MTAELGATAIALRDLGLRDASDREIFERARLVGATLFTKDVDFVELLRRHGPPPRVLWLTSGNSTNARVRRILHGQWPRVVGALSRGEPLVEL